VASSSAPGTEAAFLSLETGRRFGLLHSGNEEKPFLGALLYVHPFAEEMNKSRRVAAMQSRALAADGWTVLQVDLFGCGDSEGDFGDASWSQWVDDIRAAMRWLREKTGSTPIVWGLRAGCLLALEAIDGIVPAPDLVMWQPVFSGRVHLQQFLRLKVAGELTASAGGPRAGTQQLREQLDRGETLEIAGYAISPAVGLSMEKASLLPPRSPGRVAWLEVGAEQGPELSLAGMQHVEAFRAAGHRLDVRVVQGLPFWQTQEIAECPALIDATLETLRAWHP
jgi:uncharacterized protein